MGRKRVKNDKRVVAKTDILRSLAHIEADLCGPLSPIAAVDLKNLVLNVEPHQALVHRLLVEERDICPTLCRIMRREFYLWFRITIRANINAAGIWTFDD